MKSKPLSTFVLVFGLVSASVGAFFLIKDFINSAAQKSVDAAKIDPKQCVFEETRPYNTEYRYVIPADNKWYKARISATAGKYFQMRISDGYDYTHTRWIFQSYPRSDKNGIMQLNDGRVKTIDWGAIREKNNSPKSFLTQVTKTGQMSFRYQGEGCLVILVQQY